MTALYILLLVSALRDNGFASHVAAREGDDVLLSFNITSHITTIGKNRRIIYNFIEDKPTAIAPEYTERVQYNKTNFEKGKYFRFTLLDVSSFDAGSFTCKDAHGFIEGCSQLLVIQREPTTPDVESNPEFPVEGNQVTLTCNSTSRSLPSNHPLIMKYSWRKNGNEIQTQEANATLTFQVSRDDRGDNYSCQAFEDGLNSSWSSTLSLQPQYGPYSIQMNPDPVREGDHVTCSADCNPRCNITWRGSDGQVTSGLVQVDFSMGRGQFGTNCTAQNKHGTLSRSVIVTVLFPPEIINLTGGNQTHEGKPLKLTGSLNSNPEPNVTIHLPSGTTREVTVDRESRNFTYKISYSIDSAACTDHGLYNVTATNEYGSNTFSAKVIVKCFPRLFNEQQPSFLGSNADIGTWSFPILAYPEPALNVIYFISPGGTTKVVSLSHKHIENKQRTPIQIQSNLHEFHVDFPCESSYGQYLLSFHNTEGHKNVSFNFTENLCADPFPVEIIVVIVISLAVLVIVIAGVVIYRRKRVKVSERYRPHGTSNTRVKQEYATVPRTREQPTLEIYTKVEKPKTKPFVCRNKMYERTGHSSDQQALIVHRSAPRVEGSLNNNCGETNEDGLTYADLDLQPPTLKNGRPVIQGRKEETVYEEIDFSKTPGPQLPDKIWEMEKM